MFLIFFFVFIFVQGSSDYGGCLGHDGLVNGARCTYHTVARKACGRCKTCCLKMQETKKDYVCTWKKHKVKVDIVRQ